MVDSVLVSLLVFVALVVVVVVAVAVVSDWSPSVKIRPLLDGGCCGCT